MADNLTIAAAKPAATKAAVEDSAAERRSVTLQTSRQLAMPFSEHGERERTGIEPVTSGLQTREPGSLGSGWPREDSNLRHQV